jgi:ABC-2 type transport system ATP-binding protein
MISYFMFSAHLCIVYFLKPMISFHNVTKHYGALTAVDSLSLEITRGEFCALLGPNGAGKTTCIKMLLDFIRPDAGTVMLAGRPSTDIQSRADIGYLAENCRIPPHLSAEKFLMRAAVLGGLSGSLACRRIEAVIEMVEMKGREKNPARTYSRGMTQRIGLAAALLCSPKVLILDEPVSGLDPIGIREVRQILERLKADRVTVLLSSHLLSEAEKVCTSAAIINKGKLALKETMESIVSKGESLEDIFVKVVQQNQ